MNTPLCFYCKKRIDSEKDYVNFRGYEFHRDCVKPWAGPLWFTFKPLMPVSTFNQSQGFASLFKVFLLALVGFAIVAVLFGAAIGGGTGLGFAILALFGFLTMGIFFYAFTQHTESMKKAWDEKKKRK
jgi:hypothetical protein